MIRRSPSEIARIRAGADRCKDASRSELTESSSSGGEECGVCKSADTGVTWRTINSGLTGLGSRKLHAMAASKAAPNTIYAATDAGIFRLEDSR